MVNSLIITIVRPDGVFRLSGEQTGESKNVERWVIEARATTSKGRTVQADEVMLFVHRREIIAIFESANYLLSVFR